MDEIKFQELVMAQFEQMNKQFEQMNKQFIKIDERFDGLDGKMGKFEQSLNMVKIQVVENTRILKALEHVAEVNKSEHDRMFGEIRDIKGNIVTLVDESIKNYLGRTEFRLIAVNE
jgi:flagellar hook assembly protein FlgD